MLLFNATFNNISVISWRSVLLAEETVEPEENHLRKLTNFITLCCIEYILPRARLELTTVSTEYIPYDQDHDGPSTKLNFRLLFIDGYVHY